MGIALLLAFFLFISPFLLVRALRPYTPLAFIGFIIGVPLLLNKTPLGRWADKLVTRGELRRSRDPFYALLRREVQVVGKEFEVLPYERLLDLSDDDVYRAKNVEGIDIHFNIELVGVAKNGDLHICIDANAPPPGWKWRNVLPSYSFSKRKDGTVY